MSPLLHQGTQSIISAFIKFIKCPECGASHFQNLTFDESADFISSGALLCQKCDQVYMIHEGVLSLLKPDLADKDRELSFLDQYKHYFPEKSFEKRIKGLTEAADHPDLEWIQSEKQFWDQKKYLGKINQISHFNWNRYAVRKEHVTNYVEKEMQRKVVIEFGGGNSGTLYHIMNPKDFGYTLICTDISFNALLAAKNHHPSAIFVQCDAIEPPFRENAFDAIFDFGALHHLPNNHTVLEAHTRLLKKGGYLGLAEPTDRRPGFFSSIPWLKQLSAEQSEHNEWINEKKTIEFLSRNGKILHWHLEYSPVRSWLVTLFVDLMKVNTKWLHTLITTIDQVIIKTLGKIWNRMDGNALLLIWRKGG